MSAPKERYTSQDFLKAIAEVLHLTLGVWGCQSPATGNPSTLLAH